MKLIVFGATGSIGLPLIQQATAQGHSVTAFVRDPSKLAHLSAQNLYVVKGDVLNNADVTSAIQQHDAVLCVLGDGRKGVVRGAGTKNIIDAMRIHGLKRLICQTTLGLGDSSSNLNFFWKHIMFGWLLKKAFLDHRLQEKYVFESGLDYTIVRPSAFTDGVMANGYKVGFDGNAKGLQLKITRADVADFILQQLNSGKYLKKAVSISC